MNSPHSTPEVVLIEGDGIGPEITEAVLLVLEKAGAKLNWKAKRAGAQVFEETGEALPEDTVQSIKAAGIALKGPIGTPIGLESGKAKGFRSVNVQLRKALDLYANFRPICSYPHIKTRYENVDLIFVRENTEGLYAGLEQEIVPGVVTSLKVATRVACLRIAEFAFNYAERFGRKKVTGVHKANILKLSDGLALDCYREVAKEHPTIEYDERIIDATAMTLVLDPSKFDVILTENLYGDILSDLGAGLIGGLGLAPSGNFGKNVAVFEAVHGSAPDIAGKGVANPTALLFSAVEMLKHLGQNAAADRIKRAAFLTFADQAELTPDLGGRASTMQYARSIILRLESE